MLYLGRRQVTSDKESISGSSEQSEDSQDDWSGTDSSVDDVRQKQKKMSEELWDGVHRETVHQLPEEIDGEKVYKIKDLENKSKIYQALKDGRRWKKDCPTSWAGHARVRYADCKGSNKCVNSNCPFKVEYGVVNTTQFEKRRGSVARVKDAANHLNLYSVVPVDM